MKNKALISISAHSQSSSSLTVQENGILGPFSIQGPIQGPIQAWVTARAPASSMQRPAPAPADSQ